MAELARHKEPKNRELTPEEIAALPDLTKDAEMLEEELTPEQRSWQEAKNKLLKQDIARLRGELEDMGEEAGRKTTELEVIPLSDVKGRLIVTEEGVEILDTSFRKFGADLDEANEGWYDALDVALRDPEEEREKRRFRQALEKMVAKTKKLLAEFGIRREKRQELPTDEPETLPIIEEDLDVLSQGLKQTREDFSEFEDEWFAEGEATVRVGEDGEEVRVVERKELYEAPGAREIEPIEETLKKTLKKGPKRGGVKKLTKEEEATQAEIEEMPEYQRMTELAQRLANIEDALNNEYGVDMDKERVSWLAKIKNRLIIGAQNATSKTFRVDFAEYQALQNEFLKSLEELDDLGAFRGRVKLDKALNARVRGLLDAGLTRVKGVKGR